MPKYYFGNYLQKPNIILVTLQKAQYYFGKKCPILFWQLLQKTQYYLATIYKKPNITLATFY